MKPTKQDLQFWEFKKRPKWAASIGKLQGINIDAVINSHVPRSNIDRYFVVQNTLSLIKLHAKNSKGTLGESLRWLANSPHSDDKRLALVRRWIKRMEK